MIRNSFTKKSVGTLTLGERLRKLRSERRIAINEASRITRIQVQYLEYLEEGRYEKLPADVYVKGFLRSYGDFLGVDPHSLIKLFEKEKGIKKNLEESKNPQAQKNNTVKAVNISSFVLTPQKIIFVVVVVVIISGLAYLYKEIGSFTDAPRLIVLNPQPNALVDGTSLYIEGVTDKDASLFVNDQPILVGDDGKFRENITLQSGVNVINMKAVNKFGKEALQSMTIQSNSGEVDGPENEKNDQEKSKEGSEDSDSQEIQLEIRVDPGPVWLSVEADDNLVFSGTMLSGAIQSFNANDKIVVNSGRASTTYVKFNGKDIGTLGQDPGAVRGVVFNRDTKY